MPLCEDFPPVSMDSPTATDPSPQEKHSLYFWDTVTFSVGRQLFKGPHHYFITGSPAFARSHGIIRDSLITEGTDEVEILVRQGDSPIVLEGVTAGEFESFLKLMFPTVTTSSPMTFRLTRNEWLDILKLSTLWQFVDYRRLAIEHLKPVIQDPLELIDLAREFGISEWLVSGYKTLVEREAIIDEEVGARIGMPVASKLCILREHAEISSTAVYTSKSIKSNSGPATIPLEGRIRAKFTEELDSIEEREKKLWTQDEKDADQRRSKENEEAKKLQDARREKIKLRIEAARVKLAEAERQIYLRFMNNINRCG
ncbi:hypothetical protein DFP72DRAFT_30944 [Ephemerocybe angulata]|uniref:BTB domain-containing protein n=1 Tax=Ephemerocybe angulata TaxID=980116 RepID=A0A8H6MDG5_9AGAR|nr:hypothetical protein DFP72DRAFT_30944 [Tulosesus angulatus]